MLLQVFTIRDSKTQVFNAPFYSRTPGEAERSFRDQCNNPESMLCRYPEDYDLYAIGTYDDQTGKFDINDSPVHLVKAVQLVQPKQ